MTNKISELSKTISHALRHEPWLYELELDEHGWVPVNELIQSLRLQSDEWSEVNEETLIHLIHKSNKKRFEIANGKIRALYGHSVPGKLSMKSEIPPAILFHGTTKEIAKVIKAEGLMPMSRQYVHLSTDKAMAIEVAKRKGKDIEILNIDAAEANCKGVKFYFGNEKVWLADFVPSDFIY